VKTKPFTVKLLLPWNKFQQALPHIFISTKIIVVTIADVELAINTMESQKHFQSQLPYLFNQLPWLIGAGAGGVGGLKLIWSWVLINFSYLQGGCSLMEVGAYLSLGTEVNK